MLSIIIPTKNRHTFLLNLLFAVAKQSQPPAEVIIIDQTPKRLSKSLSGFKYDVNYYHRPDIGSLCEAKIAGVGYAKNEYLCFLDDDSLPDRDFLFNLHLGMIETGAVGMCGFVTNYEHQNKIIAWAYPFFHRGYFKGNRMGTFGSSNDKGLPKYIPTHQITGGCSIWKREIFDVVTFDLENRLHLFEDIDFSFRVDKIYSGRMFINTSAKIEDLFRESGARNFPERIYLRVLEARRIFDKYKDAGFISKDEYFYYMLGRALEALMISARELSLKPIISFFCGFKAKLKEIQ